MNSECQLVVEILKGLMSPNNEQRRSYEAQLMNLIEKNKIGLILYLSQILNSSEDKNTLIYAAVIARKLLKLDESISINKNWSLAPDEIKEQLKKNLMNVLINCKDISIKKKVSNVVGCLYECIERNDEKWETVLQYIAQGFKLELTEENLSNIDSALFLLAKIFPYATEELTPGIDVFINGFMRYFKDGNLNLQAKSVEAICEILAGKLNKENRKKFTKLIFHILKAVLLCFEKKDLENLKISIFALGDLVNIQPALFKKSFNDLLILMGKIIESKDFVDEDENLRSMAFEVIVSVIEAHPKVISGDKSKLEGLIKLIFRYAMEIEETIDDEWLTPKCSSLEKEEFIPEEKLDEALSLIERIIPKCTKEKTLPLVSQMIMELLKHSESWKYKYIAYISVGKISSFVKKIEMIDNMIPLILNDINNENPKIRYSCLYCINQFTTGLKEKFTEIYEEKVISSICDLVKKENVLRCKLQAYDSLETFIDSSTEEIMKKHIQNILDSLFYNFLKTEQCPQSLQEVILDCLAEVLTKTKKIFSQYSDKTFQILAQFLGNVLRNKDFSNINLFGLLIEVLTKVGEYSPELLKNGSKDVALTLISFQNNLKDFKGEISHYLMASWERILPYVKELYKDLIPQIIQSITIVISKPPEMSVSSEPEKKINIQDFLKDTDISGKETVTVERKKLTIEVSETQEYAAFIEVLILILEELKEYIYEYIPPIEKQAKAMITYPNNDIKEYICKIFPKIVNIVALTNDKNKLSIVIKDYLSLLIDAAEKEDDNYIVPFFINSVEECITGHNMVLSKEEVNQLFYKLFAIFDKVEKNRQELNNEEGVKEQEIKEKESQPVDEDIDASDDDQLELDDIKQEIEEAEEIITSFSDAIGALFKTHKDYCMEIASKLINDLLPKYFKENASNFEKKMGLFILDDMVEFLGQDLLEGIWTDISRILIKYVLSPRHEIRQAASYGLGEFINHTKNNYSLYANDILTVLYKGLEIQHENKEGVDDEKEYQSAQDNIITALGKIIRDKKNEYTNIKEIIEKWLHNLPIVEDISESPGQHELLCNIIIESPNMIFGDNNKNVPQIIQVLCKIIGSKYSNEEIDTKINKIFEGIKQNSELMKLVPEAKNNAEKLIASRINKYFSLK